MKNSSLQLELEYPESDTASKASGRALGIDFPEASDTGSTSGVSGFGRFAGRYSTGDYAHSARIAGRALAASVSQAEYKSLLDERQKLLDKKFADNMSQEEENRLQYVRWSLDRIEDAKYGHALDVLEAYAEQYEQFVDEVRAFHDELEQAAKMRHEHKGPTQARRR